MLIRKPHFEGWTQRASLVISLGYLTRNLKVTRNQKMGLHLLRKALYPGLGDLLTYCQTPCQTLLHMQEEVLEFPFIHGETESQRGHSCS